jgi:HSP20 family protein
LSEEDWSGWFRRKGWWPFTRRWMLGDVDEMFREMNEMMQREFKELSKRAPRDLIRERTLLDGRKVKSWGPFVYGYSVKIGSDGKPQVREFGNIKHGARLGRPRIDVKEKRAPLVDVMTTDGQVKLVAELPGVQKEDIKLHTTESSLTITVDTSQRKYHKEIELPTKVNLKETKASYKNGVLEISLQQKREEPSKGESIKIE